MGGPADRPNEQVRENGGGGISNAIKPSQKLSRAVAAAAATTQRNIFVGAQITSRTLRARFASPESLWVAGEPRQREPTGRASLQKTPQARSAATGRRALR